jgi:hypothetical protein
MGKPNPQAQDMANAVSEALLDVAGAVTPWLAFTGTCNLAISGTFVAEIVLERSFDGGETAIGATNLGVLVVFTGPASELILNRESGVLHRLRMRARTSGAALCRLSQ